LCVAFCGPRIRAVAKKKRGPAMRNPPVPMNGPANLDAFRRPKAVPGERPGCRGWILSVAVKLRSRMLRARAGRRTRTALGALDDRMLKDVGIPRHEIVWVAGHDAAREIMRLRSVASCRRRCHSGESRKP